ncbi:MAG: OmpA family protein [Pseudomonadota bacterium]
MPLLLGALLASAGALAEDPALPSLDVQLFQPSVDAPTLLGVDDSFVPDALSGSGRLLMQWAHAPLVYVPHGGEPIDVVEDLYQLDVLGGVAWHRVRLGVDLPVVLRSVGDLSGGETGIGDLSFDLKGRLLDRRSHPVGLALAGRVSVPSASTAAPLGSGAVGWAVDGILDAELGPVLLALNLGTVGVPAVTLENLTWDDQLSARLGASYALSDALGLGAEVAAHAAWVDFGNTDAMPAEALLGGWFRPLGGDWVLRLAGGTGLTSGVGAPRARALLALAYDPPQAGADRDLDGIADAVDRCPAAPEDMDAWEDDDGCPEPTQVTVKVVDRADHPITAATVRLVGEQGPVEVRPGATLPLDAGAYDVLVHADDFGDSELALRIPGGAPYEALVRLDVAPLEGLVTVRVRDGAGNPLDGAVAFGRDTPEVTSHGAVFATLTGGTWPVRVEVPGYKPLAQEVVVHGGEEVVMVAVLEPELVQLTRERIEIKESVFFELGLSAIKPESFPLLDQIAELLEAHPEVTRVRIEGHTDSRGNDKENLRLSQDRAAAVRIYLVTRGVALKRLTCVGYGESRPLDPRETDEAWATNRRVDFWIEERSDTP